MSTKPHRLEALCTSLMGLVSETSGLEKVERTKDSPGCILRFTSPKGSIATLVLEKDEVVVTTVSAADHPEAGHGTVEDVLDVDLSDGYKWDDASCRSADQLAGLLVKHMRRRTKEAAPEPGK